MYILMWCVCVCVCVALLHLHIHSPPTYTHKLRATWQPKLGLVCERTGIPHCEEIPKKMGGGEIREKLGRECTRIWQCAEIGRGDKKKLVGAQAQSNTDDTAEIRGYYEAWVYICSNLETTIKNHVLRSSYSEKAVSIREAYWIQQPMLACVSLLSDTLRWDLLDTAADACLCLSPVRYT